MKILVSFALSLLYLNSYGQDSLLINHSYFEDQIYVGINYNILTNKPQDFQQKGISTGLSLGFIKDFPLNKKGATAVALGLGYGYNKYIQNMKIQENIPEFSIIEGDYTKNKFETHTLEIPFEFRFRNSSTTEYKFWRLYLGAKFSYVIASKTNYVSTLEDQNVKLNAIPYFKRIQYGPQITFGYNTWNFYTYFNANKLFDKTAATEALAVDELSSLKIGLQFYIF